MGRVRSALPEPEGQQSSYLEQIAEAVERIGSVVQTTAANAEETAAANRQMAAQATAIEQIVDELNVVVHGEK